MGLFDLFKKKQTVSSRYEPEFFQVLGTLDKNTCEHCGEMDGQIVATVDKKIGINYPPFHDHCRCTTIAHIPGYTGSDTRWFRNPKTGKGENGPYMIYSEWKEKYLK